MGIQLQDSGIGEAGRRSRVLEIGSLFLIEAYQYVGL